MRSETIQQLKDFIRQPYAWPGGYPKILMMSDGGTICPDCARQEYRQVSNATRHRLRDGWQAVAVDIHWEGAPVVCDNCGKETEPAYGSNEQ